MIKCVKCGCHPKRPILLNGLIFCSITHATKYAISKSKQDAKFKKFSVKPRSQKKAIVQQAFNALRREQEMQWFELRGLRPMCISCGKGLGGDQWACGHLLSRGERPDLRYDELNTYLQHNFRCNKNLSGDIENYKAGLVTRFGKNKALEIIKHCETKQDYKEPSDKELYQMLSDFREQLRELKKVEKNVEKKSND